MVGHRGRENVRTIYEANGSVQKIMYNRMSLADFHIQQRYHTINMQKPALHAQSNTPRYNAHAMPFQQKQNQAPKKRNLKLINPNS